MIPSFGWRGEGWINSALMEQSISVVDPGREMREDPFERRRGEELFLVLVEERE